MPKLLFSHPRKNADDARKCRVTGNTQGMIRKYGIMMTRRTFREQAEHIGFKKVRLPHLTFSLVQLSLILTFPNLNPKSLSLRRAECSFRS